MLPADPALLLAEGKINPGVHTVVAGCNSNESTLFTVGNPSLVNVSFAEFRALAAELVPAGSPNSTLDVVVRRYAPAPAGNGPLYGELVTDNSCLAPMRFVLAADPKIQLEHTVPQLESAPGRMCMISTMA